MRVLAVVSVILGMPVSSALQVRQPQPAPPDHFLIGRRTFFDIGPPFEFYEVFSVRSAGSGTLVERITITPPGDACTQPATIQVASVPASEAVADLLGGTNPCTIPEKDLRREIKRCKKCLIFSGADITMQVQCGDRSRRIRMDVLDRDMFDPHPGTPEHTSWTMGLLGRLDQALGNSVMQRPIFAVVEPPEAPVQGSKPNAMLEDLEQGKFDTLFDTGFQKPSELFRQAQTPVRPSVNLINSSPFRPISYTLPSYPAIARVAHVGGQVTFTTEIGSDGSASHLRFLAGHVLLRKAIEVAVTDWKFPAEAAGKEIQVGIEFKTNCASAQR